MWGTHPSRGSSLGLLVKVAELYAGREAGSPDAHGGLRSLSVSDTEMFPLPVGKVDASNPRAVSHLTSSLHGERREASAPHLEVRVSGWDTGWQVHAPG